MALLDSRPIRRLQRQFWTAHSKSWDDMLVAPDIVEHLEELCDLLGSALPPGSLVIDLGCGTGNHLLGLRARGHRTIGLDGSPGMLEKVRTKAIDQDVIRAALDPVLPLRAASVDGAMSIYSCQFIDLAPFVAELARVVRPSGLVMIEVPRRTDVPADRPVRFSLRYRTFRHLKNLAANVGERVGAVRMHSPDVVRSTFERHGFTEIGTLEIPRAFTTLWQRRCTANSVDRSGS